MYNFLCVQQALDQETTKAFLQTFPSTKLIEIYLLHYSLI